MVEVLLGSHARPGRPALQQHQARPVRSGRRAPDVRGRGLSGDFHRRDPRHAGDGQIVNRPVGAALAVAIDGERATLGVWAGGGGEDAKFWAARADGDHGRVTDAQPSTPSRRATTWASRSRISICPAFSSATSSRTMPAVRSRFPTERPMTPIRSLISAMSCSTVSMRSSMKAMAQG
ncbi:transposase [Streptosporangiaceae bacterium NEAU-GS5]|nr:transposase [Streptosporangiaceae bacterium NEAU-GS5]